MITKTGRWTALLATLSLVSACGGGGGGTSDLRFTSLDDLPANGTVAMSGQARTARLVFDDTGNVTLSDVSDAGGSTLRLSYDDQELIRLALSAAASSAGFDLVNGTIVEIDGPVVFLESTDGERLALIIDEGAGGPFEYQLFGQWLTESADNAATAGVGAYGARTPVDNMPRQTVATYAGLGTGIARLGDGQAYETVTVIRVDTDFVEASISGTDTEAFSLSGGGSRTAPELDFSGSGPVSGAGFTAVVSGPATSGEATGVFHGPNAEEVAGTYGLTGPGGLNHIGAFGAN
jgi:hypothetical protein